MTTRQGLFWLPAATANMAPNFFCLSAFSSSTEILRFCLAAARVIAFANCTGGLSLGGILTHSRARRVPWQTVSMRVHDFECPLTVAASVSRNIFLSGFNFSSFLYRLNRWLLNTAPSPNASRIKAISRPTLFAAGTAMETCANPFLMASLTAPPAVDLKASGSTFSSFPIPTTVARVTFAPAGE